jgi:hypothetical protein
MGSWQIPQQEAGLARLHHFKANIRVVDEALADKALVLVSIDFNAADMLAIDHAGKEATCLNPTIPYHTVSGARLIPLTGVNGRDTDPLLANAEGVTVDHSRSA